MRMGKRNFYVRTAHVNSLRILRTKQYLMLNGACVDKLLVERISLAGIARAVSISKRWLQEYVKKKRNEVKKEAFNMSRNGKILIEADEMWTFVGDKENDALDMACCREKNKAYCRISCWKKR